MSDVLTPEQRKRCMSAIKGKNTKPELVVRRLVHGMGFRYRLHHRGLLGTPDLAFVRLRKAIFVHGCFWHMHDCQFGRVRPKTNDAFWNDKRQKTKERDQRNRAGLLRIGWRVLVVWECEIQKKTLSNRLKRFLEK